MLGRPDLEHTTTPQPATSAPSAPPMGASSMYPTIANPEVSRPGVPLTALLYLLPCSKRVLPSALTIHVTNKQKQELLVGPTVA